MKLFIGSQQRNAIQKVITVGLLVVILIQFFAVSLHAATSTTRDPNSPYCKPTVLTALKLAAKEGNNAARSELGLLLLHGHCIKQDVEAGLSHLITASKDGHTASALILGELYANNAFPLFNPSFARQYFLVAAKNGSAQAQHKLGLMLLRGEGGGIVVETGLYWLTTAASQGDAFSAVVLGMLHQRGYFGVPKNICLAGDWYEAGLLMGASMAHDLLEKISKSTDCF